MKRRLCLARARVGASVVMQLTTLGLDGVGQVCFFCVVVGGRVSFEDGGECCGQVLSVNNLVMDPFLEVTARRHITCHITHDQPSHDQVSPPYKHSNYRYQFTIN